MTDKEAFVKCIEHWHQNLDLLILNELSFFDSTDEERMSLKSDYLWDDINIYGTDCALCWEYAKTGKCLACPLKELGTLCCKEWERVANEEGTSDYAQAYAVITAMLNRLYKELEKYQ